MLVYSLAATSIRNSLLRAMRQSKTVSLASIRLLPQNFVFEFPTIVALSAFIRGFVVGSFKVPSPKELEEDKDGYQSADTPLPMSGQTVVKLLAGKGEPPLIIIHGQLVVSDWDISYGPGRRWRAILRVRGVCGKVSECRLDAASHTGHAIDNVGRNGCFLLCEDQGAATYGTV